MLYYFGSLIFSSVFFVLVLVVISRLIYKLLKGSQNKGWWLYVALSLPIVLFTFYHFSYLYFIDLPYALNDETETVEGLVDKVYFPGGNNEFHLNGVDYRRNPWTFSPEEGEWYRLEYFPNSRYVIRHLHIEKQDKEGEDHYE